MRLYSGVFYFVLILLFASCSNKTISIAKNKTSNLSVSSEFLNEIEDLKIIPQNIDYFVAQADMVSANQKLISLDKDYNQKFFNAWQLTKLSANLKELMWPYRLYKGQKLYRFNKEPIKQIFFKKMKINFNFKNIDKIGKPAIVINNADIKNFPSNIGLFKDSKIPGEGYPFDYNQNTSIKINTPIYVSHYSKDKIWAYVETPYSFGWILRSNIAFVTSDFIKQYKNQNYAISIKDKFGIFNKYGRFESFVKMGTIFSIKKEFKDKISVYHVIKNKNSYASLETIDILKNNIVKKPLVLNKSNLIQISNQLLKERYGWGGIGFKRDCSSTTQDYFSPFGIWLPRNSYAQARSGNYISFKGLNKKQKEQMILKHGIAFLTLIYSRGHIMIYIGQYKNKPVIYHNVWGVKTVSNGKIGRHIIGKTIITTLELGKELDGKNENNTLLNYVRGMSILVPNSIALNSK